MEPDVIRVAIQEARGFAYWLPTIAQVLGGVVSLVLAAFAAAAHAEGRCLVSPDPRRWGCHTLAPGPLLSKMECGRARMHRSAMAQDHMPSPRYARSDASPIEI